MTSSDAVHQPQQDSPLNLSSTMCKVEAPYLKEIDTFCEDDADACQEDKEFSLATALQTLQKNKAYVETRKAISSLRRLVIEISWNRFAG